MELGGADREGRVKVGGQVGDKVCVGGCGGKTDTRTHRRVFTSGQA